MWSNIQNFWTKTDVKTAGVAGAGGFVKVCMDKKHEWAYQQKVTNRQLLNENKMSSAIFTKKQAELREPIEVIVSDLQHYASQQSLEAGTSSNKVAQNFHARKEKEAASICDQINQTDSSILNPQFYEKVVVKIEKNNNIQVVKKFDPITNRIGYASENALLAVNNYDATLDVSDNNWSGHPQCSTVENLPANNSNNYLRVQDPFLKRTDYYVGVNQQPPVQISVQKESYFSDIGAWFSFGGLAFGAVCVYLSITSFLTTLKKVQENLRKKHEIQPNSHTNQSLNYTYPTDSMLCILVFYKEKTISKDQALLMLSLFYGLTLKGGELFLTDQLQMTDEFFTDFNLYNVNYSSFFINLPNLG